MGVKSSLAAITLTPTEVSAAFTDYEDANGMLATLTTEVQVLSEKIQWIVNAIPAGSNATALEAVITSLD